MKKIQKGKAIKRKQTEKPVPVTLYEYDETHFTVHKLQAADDYLKLPETWTGVRWLAVEGVHDKRLFERLGEIFGIHPLVIEDMANTEQRPKVYDYEDYFYITAKVLSYNDEINELDVDHFSVILKENVLISVAEDKTEILEPILERIINSAGRIRKLGPDFLLYAILDIIVDNYFTTLESFEEKMDQLEGLIFSKPVASTLNQVQQLKRELICLHKSTWPLREVVSALQRADSHVVAQSTHPYFRDVYDHIIQSMDTTDTLKDILSTMYDIYLSSTSNRLNEIMKILTTFSSIFMPLTFIAGIYGMNFKYMPELGYFWAYPAVLIFMALSAAFMLLYFKRRNWL